MVVGCAGCEIVRLLHPIQALGGHSGHGVDNDSPAGRVDLRL